MRPEIVRPAAAYLREQLDLTPDQEAVAVFGLQTLLYPALDFLCFCLAGWLLGCLAATAVVALATFVLRLFAHGAHSRSPLTCALLGVIVVPALGKTAVLAAPLFTGPELALVVTLGFLVVIGAVWRLAPADSPAKPVTAGEERQRLRLYSLLVVLLITAGQSALLLTGAQAYPVVLAMSFGLWWQAFTLTGAGHRFAVLLDDVFTRKEGKLDEASN
ncbi:MAG: accessory gene regulator B family protein [Thermacetogeniaceae bacterium]